MSFFANVLPPTPFCSCADVWSRASVIPKTARQITQRRKGAKKNTRNAAALCGFAPLRENFSRFKLTTYSLSNRKTDSRRGQDVVNTGLWSHPGLQSTNKLLHFLISAIAKILRFFF